jgi:hypothetical protein
VALTFETQPSNGCTDERSATTADDLATNGSSGRCAQAAIKGAHKHRR